MTTSAICGYGGSITGTGATEIKFWSITQTVDILEATSFDSDGWKERIACLLGATGQFRSNLRATVGAHAGCVFKDKIGGYTITADIIISRVDVSVPVEGLVDYTHDFVMTGTIALS